MSKQLKYKLKKTLKNAEFVHADLEYHQELSRDAIKDFQEAIRELLQMLSDEEQQRLSDHLKNQAPGSRGPEQEISKERKQLNDGEAVCETTMIVSTDVETDASQNTDAPINKTNELKKLFRRIAEQTHPDKVRASGFSEKEVARLESVFKRAREAYDNENWYILYIIAIDLELEIQDPSQQQVEWIEEDIKKTLAEIAQIANLTAWHWYIGDELSKKRALQYYFQQCYNFNHPNL